MGFTVEIDNDERHVVPIAAEPGLEKQRLRWERLEERGLEG